MNEHQHPSPLAVISSIRFKHDLQHGSALGMEADIIVPKVLFFMSVFLIFVTLLVQVLTQCLTTNINLVKKGMFLFLFS